MISKVTIHRVSMDKFPLYLQSPYERQLEILPELSDHPYGHFDTWKHFQYIIMSTQKALGRSS